MSQNQKETISTGQPYPLGVSLNAEGLNVAVVSRHAERIYFCVFDDAGEREQLRVPLPSRLGDVHYGCIKGIGAGTRYGLRADGPWDPASGHRFDVARRSLRGGVGQALSLAS
jgi:glycogen operon protein